MPFRSNGRATLMGAVLLSALAFLPACDGGDRVTEPSDAQEVGILSGTVSNARTRAPIAGATVGTAGVAGTTDADGRFTLTGLAIGPQRLRGAAVGFEEIEVDIVIHPWASTRNLALTPEAQDSTTAPPPLSAGLRFDLSARIDRFDPAWGYDLQGATYRALMTLSIPKPGYALVGTVTNWSLDGDGLDIDQVRLSGRADVGGLVTLEGDRMLWAMRGRVLPSGDIEGTFGCCGHIGGTFTAVRQPQD